jgi:tetratricopeptide (TPR) repeat protein
MEVVAAKANARPNPSIRPSLPNKLVDVERAEDMNEALAFAIQLEREFAPLAKTNRFELDWSYIQARALNRSKEAEEIFKSLKDSTAVGQRAEVELIDMVLAQDRYEETITLARRALTKYPDGPYEPALRQQLFLAQLLGGDKRGAIDTAEQTFAKG